MLGSPTGWLPLPDCALFYLCPLCLSFTFHGISFISPFSPSRAQARPDVVNSRVLSPMLSNPRQGVRVREKTPAKSTVQGVHCLTSTSQLLPSLTLQSMSALDLVSEGNPLLGGNGHEDRFLCTKTNQAAAHIQLWEAHARHSTLGSHKLAVLHTHPRE